MTLEFSTYPSSDVVLWEQEKEQACSISTSSVHMARLTGINSGWNLIADSRERVCQHLFLLQDLLLSWSGSLLLRRCCEWCYLAMKLVTHVQRVDTVWAYNFGAWRCQYDVLLPLLFCLQTQLTPMALPSRSELGPGSGRGTEYPGEHRPCWRLERCGVTVSVPVSTGHSAAV